MRRLSVRIIIAVFTFVVGVAAFGVWGLPLFQSRLPEKKPCSYASPEHLISKSEAVEMAECFVAAQGYTMHPPTEDKTKWQFELLGSGSTPEEVFKLRHNMLEDQAYGIKCDSRGKDWNVVFRYNLEDEKFDKFSPEWRERLKIVGRVVTMNERGEYIEIMHEDFPFEEFQKVEEIVP